LQVAQTLRHAALDGIRERVRLISDLALGVAQRADRFVDCVAVECLTVLECELELVVERLGALDANLEVGDRLAQRVLGVELLHVVVGREELLDLGKALVTTDAQVLEPIASDVAGGLLVEPLAHVLAKVVTPACQLLDRLRGREHARVDQPHVALEDVLVVDDVPGDPAKCDRQRSKTEEDPRR
jgi:hypothetical protein